MATIEEMATVLYDVGIISFPKPSVKGSLRRVLCDVTKKGKSHISKHGNSVYWKVGGYKVTYPTDDMLFFAWMLTDEMMDDLIIEVV